jgi:hypothetical protein
MTFAGASSLSHFLYGFQDIKTPGLSRNLVTPGKVITYDKDTDVVHCDWQTATENLFALFCQRYPELDLSNAVAPGRVATPSFGREAFLEFIVSCCYAPAPRIVHYAFPDLIRFVSIELLQWHRKGGEGAGRVGAAA